MLRIKPKVVVFFLAGVSIVPKTVLGQTDWHVSSQESISISLNGLKQSSKEMTERNRWLLSEIKILEMKIDSLQKQIDGHGRGTKSVEGQTSLRAKEEAPLRVEGAGGLSLKSRTPAKSQHEEKLLKEIAIVTDEIQHMNQLIDQESRSIFHATENESLERKLDLLQTNVKELERRSQGFEKDHAKSFERYESLKEKNNLLKQKLALLDDHYKKAEAGEKEVLGDLDSFESRNSKLLDEIHAEISELRTEGNTLEKVLRQADHKIKEKNAAFDISEEEIERLMENLYFIEKENRILKEKFNRTQEDIKKLDQSAQGQ